MGQQIIRRKAYIHNILETKTYTDKDTFTKDVTIEGDSKITENFEIIFSGISDNKMQFMYREYTKDDVARSAFSQELIYPTDVEFIRYKDLKIKVHDVDGESITYSVVED